MRLYPNAAIDSTAPLTLASGQAVSTNAADDVPKTPPGVALSQLLRGSLVTQLIHVAAILGIADLLSAGPKSSQDLAIAVNANPEALYRVLRALASLGIFTETAP